ncbi:MCE family protein [Stackebrandtia soli]|uniref:MCE family protein n=1 Tax=Stackebrandtia soli TaxID=1892856 RepID=UPI0039E99011
MARNGLPRPFTVERLAGLGFIVVLTALVGVCVASYAKLFTPIVPVTLVADSAGLQMSTHADVKLHGVLVGEVRSVEQSREGAVLTLALDPADAATIPADVTARLLPKTVFGEKYVELRPPATDSARPIAPGAVIRVDASDEAVELEEVLDGALPLLRAVPPEKLAVTLTSIATALDGRGDELGETMVALGEYVRALNAEMPTIEADLEKLATVLDNYRGALPDLIAILENLTVTNETIVDQEAELKALWMSTYDFSDETKIFLDRYQGRLIQFGEVTQPVIELLAAYAPEYPCVFEGLTTLEPRIEDTFATGRLHITLEITRDNGKYQPGDEPEWLSSYGPDCRGLPAPNTPGPERHFGNGYDYDSSRVNLPIEIPGLTGFLTETPADESATVPGDDTGAIIPFDPRMGYAGTEEEKDTINPIVASVTGDDVTDFEDFAALLWGPILRGMTVSMS